MINMIVAMDNKRCIGGNNKLLWNIPEDMRRFKSLTLCSTVIMGRLTWESLPTKSKPLPNRENIVVSSTMKKIRGVDIILDSLEDVVKYLEEHKDNDIFIIGGGEIYSQLLKYTDKIYVTEVFGDYDGDTYFPKFKDDFKIEGVVEVSTGCRFVKYTRRK